jgi:hypothetical protein
MLNDATGRRVVDYWPTVGTWIAPGRSKRSVELDPFVVVWIAAEFAEVP